GGGTYDGIFPSAARQLALRGEFLTAPPPVDPAASRGTLRAISELEEMTARISGLPAVSVSLHDGSIAAAEAVLMAKRLAPDKFLRLLVASSLPPSARATIGAFVPAHPPAPEEVPYAADGTLAVAELPRP